MCKALLEFPEGLVGWGGGGLKKIPFVGEVWIFFGTSHWQYYHIVTESVLILQGGIRQRSLLIYV